MITRKTIHKIFEPLQITVSVVVGGEAAQIYDMFGVAWTPDRTVAGNELTIQPKVIAATSANDVSWQNGDYISKVRDIQWYANGKPIDQVEALRGAYTIDNSGTSTNGRLTFKKNLTPGEHYDMVFKGIFLDPRTNTSVPVQTDPLPVMVTEISEDELDFSVVHDTSIRYRPLSDKLKEYDWKVANGIIAPSEAERNKCLDGNQYILEMPIIISRGDAVIDEKDSSWDGITMHLYVVSNGQEILADDAPFVNDLSRKHLVIDQRFIPDGTVMKVSMERNGKEYGSEYLTFSLSIDRYTCEPTNEGDYDGKDIVRHDVARCVNLTAGRLMRYPSAYLRIEWYTDSMNAKNVYHGEGPTIEMRYSNINIGSDYSFDVYIKSYIKAQAAFLTTDDEGKIVVTDERGAIITTDLLLRV